MCLLALEFYLKEETVFVAYSSLGSFFLVKMFSL